MRIFLSLFLLCLLTVSFVYCGNEKSNFIYDSKGKRDPFFPVSDIGQGSSGNSGEDIRTNLSPKEKLKKKGIVVNSIVWDETNPAILINDDILEVGDSIKGVIIRAIEKEYVVFEIDGDLVEIPMN